MSLKEIETLVEAMGPGASRQEIIMLLVKQGYLVLKPKAPYEHIFTYEATEKGRELYKILEEAPLE